MSKVIDHQSEWFQEVSPRDYYSENDLERVVMLNLHLIFPEYVATLFKDSLVNKNTGKKNKADLCMIKSDYSEWYVIEVELGKHTKKEVINQIDTFRNCNYTLANAEYVYKKNTSVFNKTKLINLITTVPPQLMVIVNEDKKDWKTDLKNYDCKMCVLQIYNDFEGRRLFRLDGEHPFIYTDFCNCTYEKTVPYAVKVLKADFLDGYGIANGSSVAIQYNGINHLWERQDAGNEVFLICKSTISPLDELSFRYRLNYYKTSRNQSKKGGFLSGISNLFNKNSAPVLNNSFSFTKA